MNDTLKWLWMLAWLGATTSLAQAQVAWDEAAIRAHRVRAVEVKVISSQEGSRTRLQRTKMFHYDPQGRLVGKKAFDENNRRTLAWETAFNSQDERVFATLQTPLSGQESRVNWSHTYENGRLISEEDDIVGITRQYQYNEKGQVIRVDMRYDAALPPFAVEHYQYDELGRLTKRAEVGDLIRKVREITYDPKGRIVARTEITRYATPNTPPKFLKETYQYDAAGNMVVRTHYRKPDTPAYEVKFAYNGKGQLTKKTMGRRHIHFAYTSEGLVAELQYYSGQKRIGTQTYTYQFWEQMANALP